MLPFVRHTAAEKEQEDTLLSLAPPATISSFPVIKLLTTYRYHGIYVILFI